MKTQNLAIKTKHTYLSAIVFIHSHLYRILILIFLYIVITDNKFYHCVYHYLSRIPRKKEQLPKTLAFLFFLTSADVFNRKFCVHNGGDDSICNKGITAKFI